MYSRSELCNAYLHWLCKSKQDQAKFKLFVYWNIHNEHHSKYIVDWKGNNILDKAKNKDMQV